MKKNEDEMKFAEVWLEGELIETVQINAPAKLWRTMDRLPSGAEIVCTWKSGRKKTFKISR